MPRTRPRTTAKASWDEETLRGALASARRGRGLREVSRRFRIPLSTLHNRLSSGRESKPRMGRRSVFDERQERELAGFVSRLARRFCGVTSHEVRRLAYEYAERNGVRNEFNERRGLAGKDWLAGFLKRNPRLPVAAKGEAVDGGDVARFFADLKAVYDEFDPPADRIYCAAVEETPTATVCCAANARGEFAPPTIDRVPERAVERTFADWLAGFAERANGSRERPVVLITDRRPSRASADCEARGVTLLSIPPRASSGLSPLSGSFGGSFASRFEAELAAATETGAESADAVELAYSRAAATADVVAGFAIGGIYPFDENVFGIEDENGTTSEDERADVVVGPTRVDRKSSTEESEAEIATNANDVVLSDDVCCICGEHGREEEIWFRCTTCANLSHSECSGWNQPLGYKCDFCTS